MDSNTRDALYFGQGNRTFVTAPSFNLPEISGVACVMNKAAVAFDANEDTHTDIYVAGSNGGHLLLNDGNGVFELGMLQYG